MGIISSKVLEKKNTSHMYFIFAYTNKTVSSSLMSVLFACDLHILRYFHADNKSWTKHKCTIQDWWQHK